MSFDHHDSCNTGLVLGLSLTTTTTTTPNFTKTPSKNSNIIINNINQTRPNSNNNSNKLPCTSSTGSCLDRHHHQSPSLTLSLSGDNQSYVVGPTKMVVYNQSNSDQHDDHSGALSNSFSSGRINVKRERDLSSSEDHYVDVDERINNSFSRDEDDDDGINARKKLRLTKQQSALLENNFKQHTTLNPKLKQALAKQLNLTPRQVEVWFQNRRARTKLKQTEVDCELLKKCCETLTDENRRLQKELQALKLAQPFYMHMPAATLTICPSCERIATDPKVPFSKPHHFFNPFTNNSAAC